MTNEEAIELLTAISNDITRMFGKGNGVSAFDLAIEALEKQNRIQEIITMPIQENAVKYLAICEVMKDD